MKSDYVDMIMYIICHIINLIMLSVVFTPYIGIIYILLVVIYKIDRRKRRIIYITTDDSMVVDISDLIKYKEDLVNERNKNSHVY